MYLEIKNVKKSYGTGGSYVQVLKGVNTGVEKGQMCVIQGTSGSGNSNTAGQGSGSGNAKSAGNQTGSSSKNSKSGKKKESSKDSVVWEGEGVIWD